MKKISTILAILLLSLNHNALAQSSPPPLPGLPSSGGNKLSDLSLPGETTPPSLPSVSAPKAPALPGLPTLPNTSNISKPSVASDLPTLPPLPNSKAAKAKTVSVKAASAEGEAKTEEADGEKKEKPKKERTGRNIVEKPKKLAFAIKDRNPEEIYKKHYDPYNRHLPTAYYEQEYDKLVFITAKNNDPNGLRSMLDNGRSPNMKDANGDTPLLIAVKNNSVKTAKLLLNRNADARIKDKNGFTAPAIAKSIGNNAMVRAFAGLD
jgi:outer membrane biosynthesis protein TonB